MQQVGPTLDFLRRQAMHAVLTHLLLAANESLSRNRLPLAVDDLADRSCEFTLLASMTRFSGLMSSAIVTGRASLAPRRCVSASASASA